MPIRPEVRALIDALDADKPETGERLRKHFISAIAENTCPMCAGELEAREVIAAAGVVCAPYCVACRAGWPDDPGNHEPFGERDREDRQLAIDYWGFIASLLGGEGPD